MFHFTTIKTLDIRRDRGAVSKGRCLDPTYGLRILGERGKVPGLSIPQRVVLMWI